MDALDRARMCKSMCESLSERVAGRKYRRDNGWNDYTLDMEYRREGILRTIRQIRQELLILGKEL